MDGSICKESLEISSVAQDNDQETDRGFLGTRKHLNQDRDKIFTEAKGIGHFFGRRSSGNDSLYTASPSSRPNFCVSISGRPPRGKRAFLCGVSYKKQKFRLRGAINDVHSMRDFLVEQFNFPLDSILILSEEESFKPPTRKNIEDGFKWLTRDLQFGDSLVFYYSGHGLRQADFQRG
ncbi:Metacaspase-3 [Abeliophyllum distichum]|uniref:Metacaspase-3 n=1 Tax=Abeliophyllum distichum TaxID=126358 RepID=A0ABD1TH14_9LAMI